MHFRYTGKSHIGCQGCYLQSLLSLNLNVLLYHRKFSCLYSSTYLSVFMYITLLVSLCTSCHCIFLPLFPYLTQLIAPSSTLSSSPPQVFVLLSLPLHFGSLALDCLLIIILSLPTFYSSILFYFAAYLLLGLPLSYSSFLFSFLYFYLPFPLPLLLRTSNPTFSPFSFHPPSSHHSVMTSTITKNYIREVII